MIIAHGTWLAHGDFRCFIHHGTGTAAIDWEAAITALMPAGSPAQPGRSGCYDLRPALPTRHPSASARPSPASTTTTFGLLVKAVLHASGRRHFPSH